MFGTASRGRTFLREFVAALGTGSTSIYYIHYGWSITVQSTTTYYRWLITVDWFNVLPFISMDFSVPERMLIMFCISSAIIVSSSIISIIIGIVMSLSLLLLLLFAVVVLVLSLSSSLSLSLSLSWSLSSSLSLSLWCILLVLVWSLSLSF